MTVVEGQVPSVAWSLATVVEGTLGRFFKKGAGHGLELPFDSVLPRLKARQDYAQGPCFAQGGG